VIAPLSAHTLAKIANGLCDDLLSCCLRAWDFGQCKLSTSNGKPIILAPAMNTVMWDHPLTRRQIETIQKFSNSSRLPQRCDAEAHEGVIIVEPAVKKLDCGEVGAGALADLDNIMNAVSKCLSRRGFVSSSKDSCKEVDSKIDGLNSSKLSMKRALLVFAKNQFKKTELAAPQSPTNNLIIETFIPRLNLNSKSLCVDLGCGDCRWLISATKASQCRCIGVDIDEKQLMRAKQLTTSHGSCHRIEVRRQDVFDFVENDDAIQNANVIVVYLFREAMVKIGRLLQDRLKAAGNTERTLILSVGFTMTGFHCIHEERINGIRVYLYCGLLSVTGAERQSP